MSNQRPNLNREMFYDRLVAELSGFCDLARRSGQDTQRLDDQLRVLRDEAKVFYVDSMILDSLVNQPYSLEDFNPDVLHLPFPQMFFEFESGYKSRNLEGNVEDNFWINGLLYSDISRSPQMEFIRRMGTLVPNRGFSVSSFGNDFYAQPSGPFETVSFYEGRREFLIEKYESHPGNNKIYNFDLSTRALFKFSINSLGNTVLTPLSFREVDDDKLDALKMSNLVVNLIDYVNSANVEIIPSRRAGPGIRRGGTTAPLKPYYLIEVKKEMRRPPEERATDLWTLDYRLWVRGHFKRYHLKDKVVRNFIFPYIKGPVNAPWKNNRHLMLYKNFRHRLDSRGDEDVGTSLED